MWKRCTACLTPHQQSQSGLGVTCQVCVLDSALGLLGCCEVAANACLGAGGMSTHLLQLGCCSCLLSSPPRQKSSLAKKFGMITVPKGRLELQGASHRCLKKCSSDLGRALAVMSFEYCGTGGTIWQVKRCPGSRAAVSSGGDGMAEIGEQQWWRWNGRG